MLEILKTSINVYPTLLTDITIFKTSPNYWPVRGIDFSAGTENMSLIMVKCAFKEKYILKSVAEQSSYFYS